MRDMGRITFRLFAVISLLAVLLSPAAARTRPRYGGTLRVETRSDPLKVDGIAHKLLFDNLFVVDAGWHLIPSLAVNWSSESANHRWEFHLRPGVRFHDGSPLTAEAVAMSLSQSCGSCGWHVRAVDDAVIITSESPMPNLPVDLARGEYAITRKDEAGNPDGTGTFRFAANENGTLFLRATDDSWQGRPFIDAIEIYGNRPIRAQWLDFTVGKADIVEVPPELLRSAQQEHMPVTEPQMPTDLLALTVSDQRLSDQHLRQSIALAVDRMALFNVIFQKQGEVTGSLLPSDLTAYSFLFPTAANLQRARELRGGQSPSLRLGADTSNAVLQLASERLALNLRDAGWNVQVVSQAANPRTDLTLLVAHLEPAQVGAALRQMAGKFGSATSFDPGGDPASSYRAERSFLQSHTVIPLLYLPRVFGVSARVHNLELAPDGTPELASASLEDAK